MTTYHKARAFIYRNARPLDMARWQYHFENGDKEAVPRALAAYQNEDGGFGHALEPDAWNPHSSPIQTWVATEILREAGVTDSAHPLIQGILRYLASGQDFEGHFWYNTVQSNNDYPHAPWWHTESDSTCHNDYNPTACFAGFILRFADPDGELYRLGRRIAREAFEAFMQGGRENDMHTLACYIRLMQYCAEAGTGDIFDIATLQEKLRERVSQSITRDLDAWERDYICKPSQFFSDMKSPFYEGNQGLAAYECDYIVRTQLDDGSWPILWRWDDYPEAWAIAKNWWKGNGAILNMLYLRGMGKL